MLLRSGGAVPHVQSNGQTEASFRFKRDWRDIAESLILRSLKPSSALAARVAAVVWARWLRGIIIDWRARAHDLRTGAAALGLPCALAQASCALAAPDATAAGGREAARAAGP